MLTPLDVPTVDPTWRGLACLFIAESHVRNGSPDLARRAFEQASAIGAVRQSALIALALMAVQEGQFADATALTRAFDVDGGSADDTADAWTAYVSGRRDNHAAVLDLMREVLWP